MGPASRSCRDGRLAAPLVRPAGAAARRAGRDAGVAVFLLLTALLAVFLLPDFLPAAFFVDGRVDGFAAGFLRAAVAPEPLADFLLTFFVTFFLSELPEADFLVGFLAVFFVDFLAGFLADFFGVDAFLRGTDFFFDAFFFEDFFALTLRFLPAAFLLAVAFREAVVFLPLPARFGFLLAAFFAGMLHSCRSEKNAELYIGCPNMEAQFHAIFRGPQGFSTRGRDGTVVMPQRIPPSPRSSGLQTAKSRARKTHPVKVAGKSATKNARENCRMPFSGSSMSYCDDNRFMRKITLH
jgi:hypothetical protein